MEEGTAASEFHYSKPQTTNSEKDWHNYHKKKAPSKCSEKASFRIAEKMRWRSHGNLVTRIRESRDIDEAFLRDSHDHQEISLRASQKDHMTLGRWFCFHF